MSEANPQPSRKKLEYMKYATNNIQAVCKNGGVCVYCKTVFPTNTKYETPIRGESTVLCPKCDVDAVVPIDILPAQGTEEYIKKLDEWHNSGFGKH
jgi:hypothetical protein